MTPERWQEVQVVFEAALERAPAERSVFLKTACKNDNALYLEVVSLLNADQVLVHR